MTTIDATQFMTEILGMWTEPEVDARRTVIQAHFDRRQSCGRRPGRAARATSGPRSATGRSRGRSRRQR